MDLSVIIVSADSGHFLRPCFQALRTAMHSVDAELLVVDNQCQDDTVAIAAELYPGSAVIPVALRCGFARANNLAIEHARGRYLLLLNPDTEVQPDCLQALIRYLDERPDVGIVGAKLVNPDGSLQHSCRTFPSPLAILARWLRVSSGASRRYLMLDWDHLAAGPVDWVTGACLCARRAAADQVGLLDDGFFLYYEDTDWCYRMWRGGWEVHYLPDAVALHHYQQAGGQGLFSRAARVQLGSVARLFLKHGRLRGRSRRPN